MFLLTKIHDLHQASFYVLCVLFVVVQSLTHVGLFVIPWTAARQASLSFTISQGLLKLMSTETVMPSNHLVLCHPLLRVPSIFASIRVFSKELALPIRWLNIGASASDLLLNTQDWFPLRQTALISLHSRVLWESSPTPQFKTINSSVLRLLYGPTLTSIHDYWKKHSFEQMDPCQQSDVSAF